MIYGIFGLPRSGKTTYLCKIAKKYIKQGRPVYTNFPCHGALQLEFSDLGKYDYSNAVLLIDEISLVCDSRDWKNFTSDLRYFFTNHGHYHIDIFYCSQWFTDTDVKIRRMTEELYYIENKFLGFSMRYRIVRSIKTTDTGEIQDCYSFKHGRPFYRRPYYKMFNSFSVRPFPPAPHNEWKTI